MNNTTRPSSTGGTIEYTKTGLIHRAGRQYTGSTVQTSEEVETAAVNVKPTKKPRR